MFGGVAVGGVAVGVDVGAKVVGHGGECGDIVVGDDAGEILVRVVGMLLLLEMVKGVAVALAHDSGWRTEREAEVDAKGFEMMDA